MDYGGEEAGEAPNLLLRCLPEKHPQGCVCARVSEHVAGFGAGPLGLHVLEAVPALL